MAFTSDCNKLVVVNEGIPGLIYFAPPRNGTQFFDPDPSVFIFTKNSGGFPREQQIGFQQFDSRFCIIQ